MHNPPEANVDNTLQLVEAALAASEDPQMRRELESTHRLLGVFKNDSAFEERSGDLLRRIRRTIGHLLENAGAAADGPGEATKS